MSSNDFTVARARILGSPNGPRSHRGSAAFDLSRNLPHAPHGEYSPGRTSADTRAWIPNNLICRDLSAISCLLGHVWHSIPIPYPCDQRASYSSYVFLPRSLSLSHFPILTASSCLFTTAVPTTWMIIVTAGD